MKKLFVIITKEVDYDRDRYRDDRVYYKQLFHGTIEEVKKIVDDFNGSNSSEEILMYEDFNNKNKIQIQLLKNEISLARAENTTFLNEIVYKRESRIKDLEREISRNLESIKNISNPSKEGTRYQEFEFIDDYFESYPMNFIWFDEEYPDIGGLKLEMVEEKND